MVLNRIDDVMKYYHYAFIPLYALVLSSFILTILSIKNRIHLKSALIVTALTEISFAAQLLFIGVLADNWAPNFIFWGKQSFIFLIICFILLIVLIVLFVQHSISTKKKK